MYIQMQQLTVRQASHTQLSDSRSLTTSEKQKTLTKQTPMAMVR